MTYPTTREFFNADRWKPRPVHDSALERIPTGEVLTFRVQHWQPAPNDDQAAARAPYFEHEQAPRPQDKKAS